jgi:hypothetical protein
MSQSTGRWMLAATVVGTIALATTVVPQELKPSASTPASPRDGADKSATKAPIKQALPQQEALLQKEAPPQPANPDKQDILDMLDRTINVGGLHGDISLHRFFTVIGEHLPIIIDPSVKKIIQSNQEIYIPPTNKNCKISALLQMVCRQTMLGYIVYPEYIYITDYQWVILTCNIMRSGDKNIQRISEIQDLYRFGPLHRVTVLNMKVTDQTFENIIEQIKERTGVNIIIDPECYQSRPDILEQRKKVWRVTNMPVIDAVNALCRELRLNVIEDGNSLIIKW